MLRETEKTQLLDAMTLLEIANRVYPAIDRFFSHYASGDLVSAAHDLIQHVHSSGEAPIEKQTREVLATLEAARKYMDLGGHLLTPASDSGGSDTSERTSSLFRRVLARFNVGSASAG